MKHIVSFVFILVIFSFPFSEFFCETCFSESLLKKWFDDESFFVSLENYQEIPIEIKKINYFLGRVQIKEKLYKNLLSQIKVRIIWGEELIGGWEELLLRFLKVSKKSLKQVKIKDISGYLYEKSEKKYSLVFPIVKDLHQAFLICFDFNRISLEEGLSLLEKFPLEKFNLTSGSQN